MYRGTTPTLKFSLPFTISDETEKINIAFSQKKQLIVEKQKEDCIIKDNVIYIKLSQNDTLSFLSGELVEIQIRCLYNDGTAIASNIVTERADRILKEGLLI